MSSMLEANIPVLTEIIADRNPLLPSDEEMLVAELQTKLAARTFALTENLVRAALVGMEATLFEQISAKLRQELPELVDATLREYLGSTDR